MDTERRLELALKKQRLLMQSTELRTRIGAQMRPLLPMLGVADRVRRAAGWLKRHPSLPVAVLVALLVARPRALWRWAQRGWWLWQMTNRVRGLLVGSHRPGIRTGRWF